MAVCMHAAVMVMMMMTRFLGMMMRGKIMRQQDRIGNCKEEEYDAIFKHAGGKDSVKGNTTNTPYIHIRNFNNFSHYLNRPLILTHNEMDNEAVS